jgi:glycine/D-amino acid oxidase-like deaminating enzyme
VTTRRVDHVIVGGGIVGVWLARRLLALGRSVALLEIGPADGAVPVTPRPPLTFPERENLGARQARHHVLTGNSRYWGGALIRNDERSLRGMFDADDAGDWSRDYEAVERTLGAAPTGRLEIAGPRSEAVLSDVSVLPGRKRNVVQRPLADCRAHSGFTLHCDAAVEELAARADGTIAAVTARMAAGDSLTLEAAHVVLAAGVIDTNLLALTRLPARVDPGRDRLARGLHDHWSVPIARLRWRRRAGLEWLYPPTFRGGLIHGRRVELTAQSTGGVHAGFLHVQALYDAVEPYSTIKKWMNARQSGVPWYRQAAFVPPLVANFPRMTRIAASRLVERRLYVPDGMGLTVVLDFESSSSPHNRLTVEDGACRLYWDVRGEDETVFLELRSRAIELMKSWVDGSGAELTPLPAGDTPASCREHFVAHAVDAYHLGGGLAIARDPARGLVAPDFRLHAVRNLAVVGTAAFARPGIANPVETLLAMCERYARGLPAAS